MDKFEHDLWIKVALYISATGSYKTEGVTVNISDDVAYTEKNTLLILQTESDELEKNFSPKSGNPSIEVRNETTLAAILRLGVENKTVGVLNFAGVNYPGGGPLKGVMSQEQSLAVASTLMLSQTECIEYYRINKACKSMAYTDCAIWTPDTVFFRDDSGSKLKQPVKASVLTLPAVNYKQAIANGENAAEMKAAMKRRMKIALAIFADKNCETLILGANGCGVFGNDPNDVAEWWSELLTEYGGHFKTVIFSVLDRTSERDVFTAFERKLIR
jgi:uncharacterized protein (TIGR02452 family)